MSEPSEHHGQGNGDQHHGDQHHIVSPGIYAAILLALLVATATTCGMSYIDLGEWHIAAGITLFWNPVVALAIACTKMTLVVLFFMHIKYSTKLTKLTVIAGFFIFMGLISMTLSDYVSRAWGRW
jgi:cytochrome c oxidase subunit IV